MLLTLAPLVLALSSAPAALAPPTALADFVVPAGTTQVYDTLQGPIVVDTFRIEPGAVLKVVGPKPLRIEAKLLVEIDGLLDLSGGHAANVATLGTGNQPELGAAGSAGGGQGGAGSWLTTTSTPAGGAGFGGFQVLLGGGTGGESGFGAGSIPSWRPAGGGGGALGPDLPLQAQPGLVGILAQDGEDGSTQATGAMLGLQPPQGGQRGAGAFVDGDPTNDFWGLRLDPLLGVLIQGELQRPRPGVGGGAGGDGVPAASFPHPFWQPATDKKGCGGGGGGGLGLIEGRVVRIGPGGAIHADGGDGGRGELQTAFSVAGGGSGGGSGGYLVIQGRNIDLSQAGPDCLSAVGGRGGEGVSGAGSTSAGGDGGAGVVQLHTFGPAGVLLPAGTSLADLSVPDAHLLLPVL